MGCRQQEQKPEENEIYIFFHKMEKETEFKFTIPDYDKNYDKILNLSKNKFKKLERKQSVRIGFVDEIMKTLNKLNISEREDRITRKILFYTLVLTLTLNNFLKDNGDNESIKSNNDLQQSLLTMAVKTLDYKFENLQNLKLIIYYIAKMLVILFKEMNDIDHYINIEKYIKKISSVTEHESTLDEKELYPFLKVNLSCIGEYFISNYKETKLKTSSINIIINYFIYIFFAKTSFICDNYYIYKKEIFSEKYLININEQIYKNRKKHSTAVNKKRTVSSIRNINNIINTNIDFNAEDKEKNKDKDESNIKDKNLSKNDLLKLRKDQNFLDLNEINDSFYYFFKSVIHDVTGGKNIFEIVHYYMNDFITLKSNDMRFNAKLPEFHKANEILLLLVFVKCKLNNDNVIIYSFLEFLTDQMKEGLKYKDFFSNFIIVFFRLFKDDKNLYDKNLILLSNIFILEIENMKDEGGDSFLVERILNISEPFTVNDSRLGLFISFLSILCHLLKEKQNPTTTKDVLEKICEIFDKLNGDNAKGFEDMMSVNSNQNKVIKYNLNKAEFDTILKYCDFGEKNKKNKSDYNNKKQRIDLFNSFLNFFVSLLSFIDLHFSFSEVYNDINSRKKFYQKVVSIITKLEIISIEEDSVYINEILILIRILIDIIKKNTSNYFSDFEMIYKYLNHNLYKLSKLESEEINILCFKLIYSISIFIVTQLKKIFRIPSSMQKLHNEIIKEICKINSSYNYFLKNIDIGEYQNNSKFNDGTYKFYQNLMNEFSNKKEDDDDKMIYLTNKEFKDLIDIVHNKLFGNNSPLIIYFKSQGNKLDDIENENEKYYKNKFGDEYDKNKFYVNNNFENNKDFEDFDDLIIDEEKNPNDTIAITINESNFINDMSLKVKNNDDSEEDEEDDSRDDSGANDTYSSLIQIPDNEEDDVNNKDEIQRRRSLTDSFRDEKSISNFKV